MAMQRVAQMDPRQELNQALVQWIKRSSLDQLELKSIHSYDCTVSDPVRLPFFVMNIHCKTCSVDLTLRAEAGESIISTALDALIAQHMHDTNDLEMWEALYGEKL